MRTDAQDPHGGQPVVVRGRPLGQAAAAMILVHGRGASADDILQLAYELDHPDFAYVAPQAAGHTWYPFSFLAPLDRNEPWLGSALRRLRSLVDDILDAGLPGERLMLLGFSQGACLTLEFAARNAGRYAGIIALTGGLIGPDDTPRDYAGSFDGTPVFLGTSDPDPHVPVSRVEETAQLLTRMGGDVTLRVYPGMGHTINADELRTVRELMHAVV